MWTFFRSQKNILLQYISVFKLQKPTNSSSVELSLFAPLRGEQDFKGRKSRIRMNTPGGLMARGHNYT